MIETVLVPVTIALIGGPLMWILARFDKHNTAQHKNNMHVLERIEGKVTTIEEKVSKVDERLNNHIDRNHSAKWFHIGGKRGRDH